MKNKLDKHISDLLNSPQTPPFDAWDNIEQNLTPQKKKRKAIPFWAIFSGIAGSLFMLGIGYLIGINSHEKSESTNNFTNQNSSSSQNQFSTKQLSEVNSTSISSENYDQNSNTNSNFILENNPKEIQAFYTNYITENFENPISFFANQKNNSSEKIQLTHHNNQVAQLQFENIILTSLLSIQNQENSIKTDSIDELIAQIKQPEFDKENPIKKKKIKFDRFHLSAFASPLAFNTFVGKSMLDDQFNDYPTENNVTLAYGIKGAYSVSPKLKIRTGLSMIGLEQITNDVPISLEIVNKNEVLPHHSNIKYTGNLRIDAPYASDLLSNSDIYSKTSMGKLQQQAQYIEIPLEAEYNFIETGSIGISFSGGASTWLLSKNKLYVHTNNTTQELGKAENLNEVSFSANAGLKFDMFLSNKVKFNVEPNFKYLINPVNNVKNYNPYTVGVNAGITVSFK